MVESENCSEVSRSAGEALIKMMLRVMRQKYVCSWLLYVDIIYALLSNTEWMLLYCPYALWRVTSRIMRR